MNEGREKTTCALCGETVRKDRVNHKGVCVNCLALGRDEPPPASGGGTAGEED